MIYADINFYKTEYGGKMKELTYYDFRKASRHIDILTYNRATNFKLLSKYQQDIIKECTCELVEFEKANEGILNAPIGNYSINGVSMSLKTGETADKINGIIINRSTYEHLKLSGLCNREFCCPFKGA